MKYQLTLTLREIRHLAGGTVHLVLGAPEGSSAPLPHMLPGQFVEIAVDKAKVLLNRPFSIFNSTPESLELLVKPLGRASEALAHYEIGDSLRVIAPLGRGFNIEGTSKPLLIGGGVGVAPLYYLARAYSERGIRPTIIYGERTAPDAFIKERFGAIADLNICTDDGSEGFHGLVTQHPAFGGDYDHVHVCGPMPMMKAVHKICNDKKLVAEFSLENKMACGLGACLCCVEETTTGNRCVCSDGPVFNISELPW